MNDAELDALEAKARYHYENNIALGELPKWLLDVIAELRTTRAELTSRKTFMEKEYHVGLSRDENGFIVPETQSYEKLYQRSWKK